MMWPPPLRPLLVSIAGRYRGRGRGGRAALRLRALRRPTGASCVADPAVQLFDNAGPNSAHAEPTIAAAEAGKHVICEKPLGRTAEESIEMYRRRRREPASSTWCAFNYRFVPAVRLARELIEAGELGEIYHFRASYLQDWILDPAFAKVWRLDADRGRLGRARRPRRPHHRPRRASSSARSARCPALLRTFIDERPGRRRRGSTSTTRSTAIVRVRGRRDRHPGGLALRHRPQELACAGRSTAPRARSPSTSSA